MLQPKIFLSLYLAINNSVTLVRNVSLGRQSKKNRYGVAKLKSAFVAKVPKWFVWLEFVVVFCHFISRFRSIFVPDV